MTGIFKEKSIIKYRYGLESRCKIRDKVICTK